MLRLSCHPSGRLQSMFIALSPLTSIECRTMNETSNSLPVDGYAGTLIGRAWLPGALAGPAVVALRESGVFDVSDIAATMSSLLERDEPATLVRRTPGRRIGSVEEVLRNTMPAPDESKPYFL